MLDLSTKRIQSLVQTADLSSMLKVREEALNYKIKKEKSNIQKLLSSEKISPRTGGAKERELEKWVDKEREDIDIYKRVFEENKRRTEEIIKETMGVDNIFENYEVTQETLKKLFAEKVTTPREGISLRSGFNSSRRQYELSQINQQINAEDLEQEGNDDKVRRLISSESLLDSDRDNIIFCDDDPVKKTPSLKQKIEEKLKAVQEVTFEKSKENYFFGDDPGLENPSIELIDTFKDKSLDKKISYEEFDYLNSEESPVGVFESNINKFSSKTPNIFEDSDDILPKSGKKELSPDTNDISKSLELSSKFKRENKQKEVLKSNNDDTNSNSVSLIRIKSEHNLKEETKTQKHSNKQQKEKSYNSKNFFTENFDDQQIEDAIQKIKDNPDLDQTPEKSEVKLLERMSPDLAQNVDLCQNEQTISFEEGNWKINLGETLNRNNQQKIKAIIGSANADYNNSVTPKIVNKPSNPAILVNDDGENELKDINDFADESSISDNLDVSKNNDLKKEGFFKITNKFDKKDHNKSNL